MQQIIQDFVNGIYFYPFMWAILIVPIFLILMVSIIRDDNSKTTIVDDE